MAWRQRTARTNSAMVAYRCSGMELVERRIIFAHAIGGFPSKQTFASIPSAWMSVAGPILPPANCSGAENPGVPTPTARPSTTDTVSVLICDMSSSSFASPMSIRTLSPVAGRIITLRGLMSRWMNPRLCSSSTPAATASTNRATAASVFGSGIGSSSSSAM